MSWRTVRPGRVVSCVHSCFMLSVSSESIDTYPEEWPPRVPFGRHSGVHTMGRQPGCLPLACPCHRCEAAHCRTHNSAGSVALRGVPSRPGSGGFQGGLVHHVHGDALGFLHPNHLLPTIFRKLGVEPRQLAENIPWLRGLRRQPHPRSRSRRDVCSLTICQLVPGVDLVDLVDGSLVKCCRSFVLTGDQLCIALVPPRILAIGWRIGWPLSQGHV